MTLLEKKETKCTSMFFLLREMDIMYASIMSKYCNKIENTRVGICKINTMVLRYLFSSSPPYVCISSSTYFCYNLQISFTSSVIYVHNRIDTYNMYLTGRPWSNLYDIKGKRRKMDIYFVKLSKYVKAKGRHCRAML